MGKIQYGKCGGWITPVGVLLSLLSLISAQPGFLSIDCGGKTNRTDEDYITWVTDANYINVGQTVEIFDDGNDFDSYLHTLRVFPKPLIKSCYQLPVVPDVPYLLRLWFSVGNYTGFKQPRSFAFSIETEHMLAMGNLTIFFKDMPFHNETIFVSSGRVLYICLIRTLETDDPFISAIELRMLQQGMYQQAKPGTMLVTARRCDVGGDFNSFTSYCGNPYLQIPKGACILHDTKEKKLKVIVETTLTGTPIIALALIVAIVMYRNKSGRKEQGFDHDRTVLEEEPRSFVSGDYSMGIVPNPAKPRAFTLEELIAATQSFSREIGRGGFGLVFLGELPTGKNIAVKVLSQFSQQGVQEFLNEVDLLSRIHHRNLVCLLGYCNESKEVMLIYEYMSAGSLRDHLYGPSARQSKLNWRLNWRMRLKIALDAAQGLEYLHVGCTPRIIHRDIKTANILLDSNLNGKLADFGLSRMTNDGEATHVTTAVKGTFGYLDPDTQMLTEKSDVYSFGVVLLEIISGRPPIDPKLPEEEVNIIHWATPYLLEIDENGGTITEIIDEMLGESYDMKSMTCVAKVAKRCVQAGRSCRPSMSEVVAELKEAIKLEDLLAGPVDSIEREGMEWSDDSCNISNVGR